jgi:hypothetical protein
MNCDNRFVPLVRNDGDLHLTFLNVEHRIRRIPLTRVGRGLGCSAIHASMAVISGGCSLTTTCLPFPVEDVQRGRVFRLRVLAARRPLRPGDPPSLDDRKPLPLRPRWQLPRGRQSYSLQSGYLRSPAILCEQHSPFQRRRERVRHSLSHHPRWPRRFVLATLHVESVEQPWPPAQR